MNKEKIDEKGVESPSLEERQSKVKKFLVGYSDKIVNSRMKSFIAVKKERVEYANETKESAIKMKEKIEKDISLIKEIMENEVENMYIRKYYLDVRTVKEATMNFLNLEIECQEIISSRIQNDYFKGEDYLMEVIKHKVSNLEDILVHNENIGKEIGYDMEEIKKMENLIKEIKLLEEETKKVGDISDDVEVKLKIKGVMGSRNRLEAEMVRLMERELGMDHELLKQAKGKLEEVDISIKDNIEDV